MKAQRKVARLARNLSRCVRAICAGKTSFVGAALLLLIFLLTSACNSKSKQLESLPSEIINSLGMRLRLVKPGEFTIGSPSTYQATDGSQPQHRVRITKPFYMGVHEVTQEQYFKIMETHPSHFCASGVGARYVEGMKTNDFPVDRVTWEEAVEFCGRLSDLDDEIAAGRTYRLPTEAEWEFACRAGTKTAFSCGDTITPVEANIAAPLAGPHSTLGRTTKVGSYPANALGLHDMHGNVWEWCAAGKRAYTSSPQTDPKADPSFYSMLRGGSWDYPADNCRSDHRREALSGYVYFGFRVVCETK